MNGRWMLASLLVGALAIAGCRSSSSSDALDSLAALGQTTPRPTTTDATTRRTPHACTRATLTQSFRPDGPLPPPGNMPLGSMMAKIHGRGRLRVGVDENTFGFAFRDPRTGDIEGFEVELAYEIARRIFGDRPPTQILDLVPVTTEEKIRFAANGRVDLTISANSMSCKRWQEVDFSSEYYTAVQQFLVRGDSPIRRGEDLAGKTVCVTSGSTSADLLSEVDVRPRPRLRAVGTRTDCLAALQEGEVDAYFGHDSFLYGMEVQDPTVTIRSLLDEAATTSHYGMAMVPDHPEFVRFVNAVLEEVRADGTWDHLHDALQESFRRKGVKIPDAQPPAPSYLD